MLETLTLWRQSFYKIQVHQINILYTLNLHNVRSGESFLWFCSFLSWIKVINLFIHLFITKCYLVNTEINNRFPILKERQPQTEFKDP